MIQPVRRHVPLALLALVIGGSAAVAHEGEAGDGRHHAAAPAAGSGSGGSRVSIEVRGAYRIIEANGLPNHATGDFPNRGNPNEISPQVYRFRVPAEPKVAEEPTENPFGPFGVALNGVVFDPGTNEFWRRDRESGWREEAIRPGDLGQLGMDFNHAHVQPNGAYHYHGIPTRLFKERAGGQTEPWKVVLLGYAADGFPIYGPYGHQDAMDPASVVMELKPSYRLKEGTRPGGRGSDRGPGGRYDGTYTQDYEYVEGSGDLDACNGRFGVTPEYPRGTYHYVVTRDFPQVPRVWKGTPDPSFEQRPGRPPGGREGTGPPRPRHGPPGPRE